MEVQEPDPADWQRWTLFGVAFVITEIFLIGTVINQPDDVFAIVVTLIFGCLLVLSVLKIWRYIQKSKAFREHVANQKADALKIVSGDHWKLRDQIVNLIRSNKQRFRKVGFDSYADGSALSVTDHGRFLTCSFEVEDTQGHDIGPSYRLTREYYIPVDDQMPVRTVNDATLVVYHANGSRVETWRDKVKNKLAWRESLENIASCDELKDLQSYLAVSLK